MFCEQIKFYHKKLNKEGSMTANEPNCKEQPKPINLQLLIVHVLIFGKAINYCTNNH